MKAFLDTSVLVAAFYGDHEHHDPSLALFSRQKKATGCTAAHCLTEFYAVATAMPGPNRASPHEALLFVQDIRERLTLVALGTEDHLSALEEAAQTGISGGATYDAMIARCALKADAQIIYTWNVRDFRRLGPHIAARVRAP